MVLAPGSYREPPNPFGIIYFELRADGPGTLLTLTDTFDELGKAARDGAGWHECLDRLVSDLDETPQRPMGELWVEVHPRYVTHLGPDAATIGPSPGNDPTASRQAHR